MNHNYDINVYIDSNKSYFKLQYNYFEFAYNYNAVRPLAGYLQREHRLFTRHRGQRTSGKHARLTRSPRPQRRPIHSHRNLDKN